MNSLILEGIIDIAYIKLVILSEDGLRASVIIETALMHPQQSFSDGFDH